MVKADLNVKAAGFEVRPLSPAAAAALRGAFHVAMDRPREARTLIEEARRSEPASVLANEAEALLLDHEEKRDEALAAYAADGGSEKLLRVLPARLPHSAADSPKDTLIQAAKLLEQAVRLNPDHAWSQASLARALSSLEPGDRAVEAARRAVTLEPGVIAHRLALVQALWNASREAEARRAVQAAQAVARDETDRKRLQEWGTFMSSRPK